MLFQLCQLSTGRGAANIYIFVQHSSLSKSLILIRFNLDMGSFYRYHRQAGETSQIRRENSQADRDNQHSSIRQARRLISCLGGLHLWLVQAKCGVLLLNGEVHMIHLIFKFGGLKSSFFKIQESKTNRRKKQVYIIHVEKWSKISNF